MHSPSLADRHAARVAIVVGLMAIALLLSVAAAYAASPNGGFGDTPARAGIAGPDDRPIPVEPDGGIGSTPDDRPIPVEPDGGIGSTP